MKFRRGHGAFSLLEILIAISIMMLLVSLLLPEMAASKFKAKLTSDSQRMHQLALAGAMYYETNGAFPEGCANLAAVGTVTPDLCGGIADGDQRGLANDYDAAMSKQPSLGQFGGLLTPYKNSFFGRREFMIPAPKMAADLANAQNVGWLCYPVETTWSAQAPTWWEGPYLRITNEAAVVRRTLPKISITFRGRTGLAFNTEYFFGDLTPEDARKIK